MKLSPALKQKKRYVVFEVDSEVTGLKDAVANGLIDFLGQLGISRAAPLWVKSEGRRFMLKVNHKYVDDVVGAMILIKKIKNKPVIIKSIITSGTIRKASESMR